jgi:endonuclease/exonuclease/phosphatase family metal-dependent hydrolase
LREQRKLSVFNRIMLWLHYILLLSLLISISAKYISPVLFWIPAFFGLAFPFLFILNVAFMIYWLIQFKMQVVFGFIGLIITIPTAYRYVQISITDPKPTNKQLKITSYNCMLFDLYNWYHDYETRPKIFGALAEIHPDILCLQEFYTSEQKGDYNNIDSVKRYLNTPYYHCEYTTTLRDLDHWGIATFSKYPFINQGKIVFNTSKNNICIYSDVVINKDTLRIYNVHFQSVGFSHEDNKFLEDMMNEKPVENEMDNSKNILRRLKTAFIKRTMQVNMIVAHMKTCRYKIILCGDFNDTGASFTYEKLTKNLGDCFLEKGLGLGRTYAGKWPQFRIDYILHDKALTCSRYKRSEETFTDHYPITAYFDNINWDK